MNNKHVLLIATEYPPASASSGVQRILKFSQYLPDLGWDVSVLTMNPMAYGKQVDTQQLSEIPSSVFVQRALAFNASIHFAIKGRYLRFMALPDRWSSWVVFGFFAGLKRIRQQRPDVLFSSYPHASAHLLALLLHRVTGIPWVADFRDPMLYRNNHLDWLQTKVFSWVEMQTMRHCHQAIFTTPGAIEGYAKKRYSEYPVDKWHLIANAFDEGNFEAAEAALIKEELREGSQKKPLVLVHAGLLYRSERDPTCFFKAVHSLLEQGVIADGDIKIILRAPGSEAYFQGLINEYSLVSTLFIEPRISYQNTLMEMFSVDGLLLFQGSLCNHQIPAKVYEYFRAKKPIFALTDSVGDTASLLQSAGIDSMADLNDEHEIATKLSQFLKQLSTRTANIAADDFVREQSREARTKQLAHVLNLCVKEG